MRWNCPHCGVNLAVADNKLNPGWSFSRCYKCGGFALVRKTEVNLIKVDRAPAGEQVILPESAEEPLLSREATNRLAKYIGKRPANNTPQPHEAPLIIPAGARMNSHLPGAEPQMTPWQNSAAAAIAATSTPLIFKPADGTPADVLPEAIDALANAQAALATVQQEQQINHNIVANNITAPASVTPAPGLFGLPEPLPEVNANAASRGGRILPFAIGMTAFVAVGSGIYLYIQGQALWNRSRAATTAMTVPRNTTIKPASALVPGSDVVAAPSLISRGNPGERPFTDQVRHNAMAPTRVNDKAEAAETSAPVTAPGVTNTNANTMTNTSTAPAAVPVVNPGGNTDDIAPAPDTIPGMNNVNTGAKAPAAPAAKAANVAMNTSTVAANANANPANMPTMNNTAATATAMNAKTVVTNAAAATTATTTAAAEVKPVQALVVQPKTKGAEFHTGPGSLYPLLGLANPAVRYIVADWNDRWFKVIIPENPMAASPKTAWVRTDMMKIVPANANEQLQSSP